MPIKGKNQFKLLENINLEHQLEYFKLELFLFYMLLRRHSRRWVKYSSIIVQSKKLVLIKKKFKKIKEISLALLSFCCIENVPNRTVDFVNRYTPIIIIYNIWK